MQNKILSMKLVQFEKSLYQIIMIVHIFSINLQIHVDLVFTYKF